MTRILIPVLTLLLACDTDTKEETTDTSGDTAPIDADGDGFDVDVDCDDADAANHPDADEVCDGVDNNCDGTADDDAIDQETFYADADGDGYGDAAAAATACAQPSGHVTDSSDCDDATADVSPGAPEVCDTVDNDCDGEIDEDVTTVYYADADGDGYGDLKDATEACEAPSGYIEDSADCDDADAGISPAATERCDGIDNDCDSATTEDGMASFVGSDGSWSDWSDLLSGSVSVPEGTVYVCAGTWNVHLELTDGASVIGAGMDETVLDGSDSGTVVVVSGDASMEGLTIQGGVGSSSVNGFSNTGGGVACNSAAFSATSVRVLGNDASHGGGIGASLCELHLDGVEFVGNTASYGAGLIAYDSDVVVTDNTVSGNVAGVSSAFYIDNGTVDISGTAFEDNGARYGAAILVNRGVQIDVSDSVFYRNTAETGYGGAIRFALYFSGFLSVTDSDFGTEGSSDDNATEDLSYYSGVTYDYGDGVSFDCDDEGCE